jgi:Flp pilus assembly secretin CpaC
VFAASLLAGIDAITGKSYHVNSGVALTVIGIATAAGLGYVAAGLARARRWSRTPALLTQLFTGIVSIYLIQGQKYGWGVPGLVLAVAGFATVLAPPSMRALTGQEAEQPAPPPR